MSNIKYIYFYDCMGDGLEESKDIKRKLSNLDISIKSIELQDIPNWLNNDEYFDVLFFDWGGMAYGNSLLENFCTEIIKHAVEHSSRLYIMTSSFTSLAMSEILDYLDNEKDFNRPTNICLSIKKSVSLLKDLIAKKE